MTRARSVQSKSRTGSLSTVAARRLATSDRRPSGPFVRKPAGPDDCDEVRRWLKASPLSESSLDELDAGDRGMRGGLTQPLCERWPARDACLLQLQSALYRDPARHASG